MAVPPENPNEVTGEIVSVSDVLDGSTAGEIPEQSARGPEGGAQAAGPAAQSANGASAARNAGELVSSFRDVETGDALSVARVGVSAFWRLMKGVGKGGLQVGKEIATEVRNGEPVSAIIDHRVDDMRNVAVAALGLDSEGNDALPLPGAFRDVVGRPASSGGRGKARNHSPKELRRIGNSLLSASWRTSEQSRTEHPAFGLILQSITPDEARLLRFLAVGGPQPAVDVRTKTPFGVGSDLLAGFLNMVCDMSGCTWPDKDQEYLANLTRLGLVRMSHEPVTDFRRYSFIECQPKVVDVMAKAKKTTTVYRSIFLSEFGQQFCDMVFELDGYDAGGWDHDDRGDQILGKGTPPVKHKHH